MSGESTSAASNRPTVRQPVSWLATALCFVGAQFIVVPFLLFLALISDGGVFEAPGAYVAAALLLAGGVGWLRMRPGLFASQLALSGLLSGLGLLFFSLLDHVSHNVTMLMLAAACIVIILSIDERWIQNVLGATVACALLLIVGPEEDSFASWQFPAHMFSVVLLALAWTLWSGTRELHPAGGLVQRLDALCDGLGVAVALSLLSGESTLLTYLLFDRDAIGSADAPLAGTASLFSITPAVVLQSALVVAAFAWLVWRQRPWPRERRQTLGLIAVLFVGLALFAPFTAGGQALAILLAGALAEGRRRMQVLIGLVLLAKLSGFYYALHWPLVDKAVLLAGTGAMLGMALWLIRRLSARPLAGAASAGRPAGASGVAPTPWRFPLLLLAALAIALGAVHWDVRGKETVISSGRPIYIALAPRDPRSLMQGDYMALNFAWPRAIGEALAAEQSNGRNTRVVARVDARGVATVIRWAAADQSLAADEILLPLKWMNGGWTLVTDAYFFPEGQGASLASARFGEFRVLPDGRALLVGLADEHLQALQPRRPPAENMSGAIDLP